MFINSTINYLPALGKLQLKRHYAAMKLKIVMVQIDAPSILIALQEELVPPGVGAKGLKLPVLTHYQTQVLHAQEKQLLKQHYAATKV